MGLYFARKRRLPIKNVRYFLITKLGVGVKAVFRCAFWLWIFWSYNTRKATFFTVSNFAGKKLLTDLQSEIIFALCFYKLLYRMSHGRVFLLYNYRIVALEIRRNVLHKMYLYL